MCPDDGVRLVDNGIFLRLLRYAWRIMETKTQTSTTNPNGVTQERNRWPRSSFFTAFIGACGFGMHLGRTLERYRDQGFWSIALGLMFLVLAIVSSIRVLPFIPKVEEPPQR